MTPARTQELALRHNAIVISHPLLIMAETQRLFAEDPNAQSQGRAGSVEFAKARPWVLLPNRRQMESRPSDLESLLPEGHRARLVWGYVERGAADKAANLGR